MTRLMFWNVNNFGSNAFFPPNTSRKRKGNTDPDWGASSLQDANDRLQVLLNIVRASAPALISIVEVKPGVAGLVGGQVVADDAAKRLQLRLRRVSFGAPPGVTRSYRLVPPVVSGTGGRTEGVAVYYDDAQLQFLGPYGWSGAASDTVANILGGGGALAGYGAPWGTGQTRALPNRVIPGGWTNSGRNESTLAAQWRYTGPPPANAALDFPTNANRRPYLTYFRDIAGGRLIKLLSFHAPPEQVPPPGAGPGAVAQSVAGTAQLQNVQEVTGAIGANEVRCIVGDFNVSSFDAVDDAASYALLRAPAPGGPGFTQGLLPAGGQDQWPDRGYYATHVKGTDYADPCITKRNVTFGYPGFNYVSYIDLNGRYDAIDNVFTRYGGGAGGPAANLTVANPVTGSPYNLDPAPPAGVPHGTVVVPSQLANAGVFDYDPANLLWGIDADTDPNTADDATIDFRQWDNFALVRSTSDHLPLVVDI